MHILTEKLFSLKDDKYREFHKKLVPDTSYEIIGVRIPELKQLAKAAVSDGSYECFLKESHRYYEEWMLHGLLIAFSKRGYDSAVALFEEFLPHIDNWAICDTTVSSMKILAKNTDKTLEKVRIWLTSENTYTVRVGVVSLLCYFSGDNFFDEIFTLLDGIKNENYYVEMAVSWLYSVLLVKHYNKTVLLFESGKLKKFIHNKSIQKALESYRIDDEKKQYLKTLKIR